MQVGWAERDGSTVLVVDSTCNTAELRVVPSALVGRSSAAMSGRWEIAGDSAVFVPRYPFLPDTGYAVVLGDGGPVVPLRTPPAGGTGSTTVVAVEPALDVVPRNLLRIVVTFSAPMSEGHAGRCVRLESADGVRLPGVFLADPELWDAERRRLTVLLDPARIKRGLLPHREAGYPLVAGTRVRVLVDAGWPDAGGLALAAGASRTYRVGADLRGRVRPETWDVGTPPPGTRDPLRLAFHRPLDRRLVARRISVPDVPGVARPEADGRAWSFVPDEPWPPGVRVRVVVDPSLEDVAGNSVARVFDRNLSDRDDDPLEPVGPFVLEVSVAD